MQFLLLKDPKDKIEIVVWHDVLNNSICRYKSNNYQLFSVSDPIYVLKTLQDKLSALVFCQCDRTPYIFDSLKELEKSNSIHVYSIVKDFVPIGKENKTDLLNQLKALHQNPEVQLKTSILSCGKK